MTASGGPSIVAVGGGHGLAATLRAAKTVARSVCAVVSTADDGGSTGRLRDVLPCIAPGDLRMCLSALADPELPMARALEYRFSAGELDGHALGNLLITAMTETEGGVVRALDALAATVGATGRVLPATAEAVTLVGTTDAGREVRGQVNVMSTPGIREVRLEPAGVPAIDEAVDAILTADMVVLGPGSLYTSVLAATAVDGIAAALAERSASLVYVCNLRPQHGETEGYDVADHVAALRRHGLDPAVVLYDGDVIGGAHGVPGAIRASLAGAGGSVHDEQQLASALLAALPALSTR